MFCPLKVFLFLCIVGMVLVVLIIFFQNYQKFRSNIFFIMNNTPGNAQRQGVEPRRASTPNAIPSPKPHFHCKHSNFWSAYRMRTIHMPKANQKNRPFGLHMPKTNQKNRPFGLLADSHGGAVDKESEPRREKHFSSRLGGVKKVSSFLTL